MQRTLSFLLSIIASTSCRTPDSAVSDPKLIGGTVATASDIPYVVFFRTSGEYVGDGCTATKIAPKMFITAAHCLLDSDNKGIRAGLTNLGDVKFTIDSPRQVQFGDDIADDARLTVENLYVHPQYVETCQTSTASNCGEVLGKDPWPPDVGIIEIKEDTPSIPLAKINFANIPDGTKVIVAGYGCEDGLYLPYNYSLRLKFGETSTVPPTALDISESIDNFDSPTELAKTVWITKGLSGQGVSLCPGDSGGPMFRADVDPIELAGINSNYSFLRDDDKGIAKTNWHTRLDNESRYGINQWVTKVLSNQETPTTASATRLVLNDAPGVVYLTSNLHKSEQTLKVSVPQTVEISTEPSGTATVQVFNQSNTAAPLTAESGTTYKLAVGDYLVVSTLTSTTNQALLNHAHSNPPLDFGVARSDLISGSPAVSASLVAENTLATFRMDIPADGKYRLKIVPPQKMLVLFFSPDDREAPFYSETTESDGLLNASFGTGELFNLVIVPADSTDTTWPKNFTVQFEGPM